MRSSLSLARSRTRGARTRPGRCPSASIVGELVGTEERGYLRFDGLGQKGTGAAAQNVGQRIGKRPWLGKLDDITVGHGVSLLQWRSGARTATPHIAGQDLRLAEDHWRLRQTKFRGLDRVAWPSPSLSPPTTSSACRSSWEKPHDRSHRSGHLDGHEVHPHSGQITHRDHKPPAIAIRQSNNSAP
jgi:hypothetical protein